ncbi:hypothetical protein EUX98_g8361 [Antrodiella citrinella]|uniref:HAT C-terminal dimerisation domain-containing protein n=1 Tax=Antrodiella citrinella TaxID=2447956 RepID=A0A4S4MEN4_9APHY|nr:hypothetical protein EUX98_g8361 [Antrodiella citrinella]
MSTLPPLPSLKFMESRVDYFASPSRSAQASGGSQTTGAAPAHSAAHQGMCLAPAQTWPATAFDLHMSPTYQQASNSRDELPQLPGTRYTINSLSGQLLDDGDDDDYSEDSDRSSESETDVDNSGPENVSNAEVVDLWPRQSVPQAPSRGKRRRSARHKEKKTKRTKRSRISHSLADSTSTQPVRDPSVAPPAASANLEAGESTKSHTRRPAIYYFYEEVLNDALGRPGNAGDNHYRCYHGDKRIITVTKAMKRSQTSEISLQLAASFSLINNLKKVSPEMHKLWQLLKNRITQKSLPPTADELLVAAGRKPVQVLPYNLTRDIDDLATEVDQDRNESQEPWDQEKFEDLLAKWMAVTNQPFTATEVPEYIALLEYVQRAPRRPHIPASTTMSDRIMNLADEKTGSIRQMIENLDSKVSLSLDLWTSSNGYVFLAIVMHYVSNDWQLVGSDSEASEYFTAQGYLSDNEDVAADDNDGVAAATIDNGVIIIDDGSAVIIDDGSAVIADTDTDSDGSSNNLTIVVSEESDEEGVDILIDGDVPNPHVIGLRVIDHLDLPTTETSEYL